MIERNEELVTVFGGGGFIGRYVCESLFKSGVRVRIAQPRSAQAYFLQPLAQVGQFGSRRRRHHQRRAASTTRSRARPPSSTCAASSAARCSAIHVEGARNVAEAARDAGAGALVHISAIGADPDGQSELRPHQGRGRGGASRGLPGRDDHPAVARVRPRGRPHQPLRRDGAPARPPGDRGEPQFPAGLCARSRQGDRACRARARPLRRQDLRDRRPAGDEHGRASPRDPRRSPARIPRSSTCPTG